MAATTTQIREHTAAELNAELGELREQLFKLRWQASGRQIENPNKIKMVRRDIARRLTVAGISISHRRAVRVVPAKPPFGCK